MKPVRIIDKNFNLLGEMDEYISLEISRKWSTSGNSRLVAISNTFSREVLKKGNIFFTDTSKAQIIISVEYIETQSETRISILGQSLDAIFNRRITLPESFVGQARESIIKSLINSNISNPADANRKIDIIETATDQSRGEIIDFATEKKKLSDEIAILCINKDISLIYDLDIADQKIVFDVSEGLDRTFDNGTNPQAIFSREYDNIKGFSYSDSDINRYTFVYVDGTPVGSASGLDRFEGITVAGDLSAAQAGANFLAEFTGQKSIECQVVANSNLTYEKDYDLGDIVTIKSVSLGITLNTRITEINEIYEANNIRMEILFGDKALTLTQILKQRNP